MFRVTSRPVRPLVGGVDHRGEGERCDAGPRRNRDTDGVEVQNPRRAPALRRTSVASLPDRQRRAHRRELRRVDLLRAPAPATVGLPRFVLPVHGRRHLPRAGAVGRQLDHGDVPARQLGPHPRQHALPRHLRQERRGRLRAARLPRLLLRRRLCRDDDADGTTLAFGTAAEARVPNLGASGAIAAVLAPTSSSTRARGLRTGRHLPGPDPGLVLPRASGSCTS